MTRRARLRCTAAVVIGGLALSAAAVLGFGSAASAHNFVVSTTPAEGETLTELPDRFDITTNDSLLDVTGSADAFVFDIIDADGLYYGDGCVTVEGNAMYTTAALGTAGTYTISYQFVSADGHSVSGEYDFDWAPLDGEPISVGWGTPAECGVDRAAEPTEEPSAEPTAEPTDEPTTPAPEAPEQPGGVSDDLLWVGGAVAAIIVAVLVAALVLRRRK